MVTLKENMTFITNYYQYCRYILYLTLPLILLSVRPAYADIKCWYNDQNIRECGALVPPEHAHKRIEILNENGMLIKVIEAAKTEKELAAEREAKREQERLAAIAKEQARLDNILLSTYTTERDLLIARDNNLKAIDGIIDISRGNLRLLQDTLAHTRKRAADYERGGKQAPQKLIDEMQQLHEIIEEKKKYIEQKQKEKNKVAARFAKDIARFRKLKQN